MGAHDSGSNPVSGLAAVFIELRPALARFLTARGAQAAEAEDLLQDLYLKLGDTAAGPIAEPRAYLYRMANNLMIDLRRSSARRSTREQAWTSTQSGDGLEIDPRPSAEDSLLARDRLRLVETAINALPDRTSDIFRRYRLRGDAQKVIAADLGLSVSAVEKHLQRAYRVIVDARVRYDADLADPQRHSGEGETRGG